MYTKNLEKMIEDKYISVQKHPTEELYIYNYTQKAQYDKVWNEDTLSCRGLIMDGMGTVMARPFKKFFNLEEVEGKIPSKDFIAWEKYDGSLGILYWIGELPHIATRGSFISDQAREATKILWETVQDFSIFDRTKTYLFEIIYPENRIVVDYGDERKLVYLTTVDIETGEESFDNWLPFEKAKQYNIDLDNLEERENSEGYVLQWKDGYRLKVKHKEYVRLHRLLTQITARSIWDLLKNKQDFDELLERVPDEFYKWVKEVKNRLENQYTELEENAKYLLDLAKMKETRKEQAEIIKTAKYPRIVFSMLDNKDYSEVIWKILYPKHETPFKQDI